MLLCLCQGNDSMACQLGLCTRTNLWAMVPLLVLLVSSTRLLVQLVFSLVLLVLLLSHLVSPMVLPVQLEFVALLLAVWHLVLFL